MTKYTSYKIWLQHNFKCSVAVTDCYISATDRYQSRRYPITCDATSRHFPEAVPISNLVEMCAFGNAIPCFLSHQSVKHTFKYSFTDWYTYFAVEAFERQICFVLAQDWELHIGGYCILFGLEKLGLHHFNLYCASLTWTMSPLKAAASRLTSKLRRAVTCKSWWLGAIVHCTS